MAVGFFDGAEDGPVTECISCGCGSFPLDWKNDCCPACGKLDPDTAGYIYVN